MSSFLLLLLPALGFSAHIPNLVFLDENCDGVLSFTESVRLQYSSSTNLTLPTSEQCFATLQADTNREMQVRFVSISLPNTANCSEQKVEISDSTGPLTPETGVCGTTVPTSLYRTNNTNENVKISLITYNNQHQSNFGVLLTAFSVPENGSCLKSGDFLCDNRICISQYLKCNGYDECGDGSDERAHCYSDDKTKNREIIIGVSATIAAIVGVITVCTVCLCCRRRLGYTNLKEHEESLLTGEETGSEASKFIREEEIIKASRFIVHR